ncbi:S8 family serine peptidase [Roseivirga sp. BDSF3-8]|uniref:S8 family serine peptidase n=1 Tax=Roseivirga sp. BDSF3-8 TaxID=3241598 RepID=UPI00353190A8
MKKTLLHLLLLFLSISAAAQQKYWVFFDSKPADVKQVVSQATLDNRAAMGLSLKQYTDLPVDTAYIRILSNSLKHRKPHVVSRWLNAVTVPVYPHELDLVAALPFVTGYRAVATPLYSAGDATKREPATYAMGQIGAGYLQGNKLDGSGVSIGVIDAGFFKADRKKELEHLFAQNRVLAERDFIKPDRGDFYRPMLTGSDTHGTRVLENIAGLDRDGNLIGVAFGASFYLARTDHGSHENRMEEDYWVAALEWMDSLGVRLINSSLGYSDGFDDPSENHKPVEMDGKTVPVTRAAQIATTEKGMLIIASAGNEGDRDWKVLSAPADAPGVIAVGACGLAGERLSFSSMGQEGNGIKPEVCCYSNTGTSFSTPVITGLAACLMQYNDTLTGPEVKTIIEKSSTLYPYGNNYVGYGIPQAADAIKLAGGETLQPAALLIEIDSDQYAISPDWMGEEAVVIFNKKNAIMVEDQNVVRTAGKPLTLFRKEGVEYTTVVAGRKVLEIKW